MTALTKGFNGGLWAFRLVFAVVVAELAIVAGTVVGCFEEDICTDADTQAIFDAVRTGMKVKKKKAKEVTELWTIAPRLDQTGLRENYVNKNIFRIGDLVESLNTGLVGRIIRRGTNHLICLTNEENMFKSWIRDVMEYTEVRMKSRMRDKTHPNMLVGTTGYRKNAQAMVPGQEKIKNFNIKEFINKYRKK